MLVIRHAKKTQEECSKHYEKMCLQHAKDMEAAQRGSRGRTTLKGFIRDKFNPLLHLEKKDKPRKNTNFLFDVV